MEVIGCGALDQEQLIPSRNLLYSYSHSLLCAVSSSSSILDLATALYTVLLLIIATLRHRDLIDRFLHDVALPKSSHGGEVLQLMPRNRKARGEY